jgi:hypothetical protein
MRFLDAMRHMSERKIAALGSEEARIVQPDVSRLLCAGTGVDYEDVDEAAKTFALNAVQTILEGQPLVAVLEGYFFDALLTGQLAGSEAA